MDQVPPAEPAGEPPRISRHLQVLTAVLLIGILAVTVQQLLSTRAAVLRDTEQQMSRLDMVFAEQTGRALETVDVILEHGMGLYREAVGARPVDQAALRRGLARLGRGVQQIQELAITNAAGFLIASSRPGPLAALPERARQALLHSPPDPAARPQISEPFRLPDGRWTAIMFHPVNGAGGRPAGYAVAFLNMLYFENFYRAVQLPENGAILLHRRDGTVLARYPHADTLIGASFGHLAPWTDVLDRGEVAGTMIMDSPLDGNRRVLAIRALKLFPVAVNVSVGERQVLAPWRRQTVILGSSAAAAAIAVCALLLMLAQRSHQVETLFRAARAASAATAAANAELRHEMEERARTEEALRHAQRAEAIGQLTGGVAHDFNNLLAVVMGNIDLLERSAAASDATMLGRLATMRAAVERGATLTGQLLAFARRQPLLPRAVDLNGLLSGLADLLRSGLGRGVALEMRLHEGLCPALVDATQMELAVLNLAVNARDAMPNGGVLRLETGIERRAAPQRPEEPPAGDYVWVAVRDTGTGMPPEILARAFEPFFTTKEVGRGSGLGLSQVYGLAKQSGGGLHLASAPGRGTSITVFLPCAEAPQAAAAPSQPAPSRAAGRARVLVVDDDAAVRATTGALLRDLGYAVVEAAGGPAALDRLRADPEIEVMLTDVVMPGMTGPEVARRAQMERPLLPVVFVSGYADPEALTGDRGMGDLLRKPFRPAELAERIEAALAEAVVPAV